MAMVDADRTEAAARAMHELVWSYPPPPERPPTPWEDSGEPTREMFRRSVRLVLEHFPPGEQTTASGATDG